MQQSNEPLSGASFSGQHGVAAHFANKGGTVLDATSSAALEHLPSQDWVKGPILVDSARREALLRLQPMLKAILDSVRDMHPIADQQPDEHAKALKALGLPENLMVHYIPLEDLKLLTVSARQNNRAEAIRVLMGRSFPIPEMGLIRGQKLEIQTFELSYTVTNSACPHRALIEQGITKAALEFFKNYGQQLGVTKVQLRYLPEVWKFEDMSPRLQQLCGGASGLKNIHTRMIPLTVGGTRKLAGSQS